MNNYYLTVMNSKPFNDYGVDEKSEMEMEVNCESQLETIRCDKTDLK
jgi:hypothetical protein